MKQLEQEIILAGSEIEKLENEKIKSSEDINKFRRRITDIEKLLYELEVKSNKFDEFIKHNAEYLSNRALYKEYSDSVNKLLKEKSSVNDRKNALTLSNEAIFESLIKSKREKENNNKKYKI